MDLIAGHLSFSVNGEYLGVAFDDIDCSESYRLAVSMKTEFEIEISIGWDHKVLREWTQ